MSFFRSRSKVDVAFLGIKNSRFPTTVFLVILAAVVYKFPVETGLCFILYLVSENSNRNETIMELSLKVNRFETDLQDALEELRDLNNNFERRNEHLNLDSGEVVLDEPPQEDLSSFGMNLTSGRGVGVGGLRIGSRLRARGRGFIMPPPADINPQLIRVNPRI